jgi:hypothetical protein
VKERKGVVGLGAGARKRGIPEGSNNYLQSAMLSAAAAAAAITAPPSLLSLFPFPFNCHQPPQAIPAMR